MLQGAPFPLFMHDSLINKIFGSLAPEELNLSEKQIQDGLSRFGLVKVAFNCNISKKLGRFTAKMALYIIFIPSIHFSFSTNGRH